jgi:hypothetical protein
MGMDEMTQPRLPWWRVRLMWLVIGGPVVVVVAACITAFIAIAGADRVLPPAAIGADATAPATQARNHAAEAK